MPEKDFDAATAAVKRAAEPDAATEIWTNAREQRPGAVPVDGRTIALAADPGGKGSYRPREPRSFLEAIVARRRADLVGAAARRLAALSTAGAAAALLYMDERQYRVGTISALVRRGPKPAAAVPRPPALPVVKRAPPSPKARRRGLPASTMAAKAWRTATGTG